MTTQAPVLDVKDLTVTFAGASSPAVDGVSFSLQPGEVLGVAGESGSGKSSIALATLGLLPRGTTLGGSIRFRGQEILGLPSRRLRPIRGRGVAMIFQESVSALHPMRRIGDQLVRVIRSHFDIPKHEAAARAARALEEVRLEPDRVLGQFPHELSGGMCQRVMIAMSLSCGASVLLADEPTTALDVSLQGEILELLRDLVRRRDLSIVFISHDLAVLGDVSDRVMVLYRGEVKEIGGTGQLVRAPQHPYSSALLACVPRFSSERLTEFPEIASDAHHGTEPGACNYLGRCPFATTRCHESPPLAPRGPGAVRCWHPGGVVDVAETLNFESLR